MYRLILFIKIRKEERRESKGRVLLLIIFLLCAFAGVAQEPDIPEGYTVDTLLRESETHPGVYDTIITYKKVNIVHKEIVVEDTSSLDETFTRWRLGIAGGYRHGGGDEMFASTNSGISISRSGVWSFNILINADINQWSIQAGVGVAQLRQQWYHTYQQQHTVTSEYEVKDTVDTYYVENENGEKTPHYVIHERTEETSDTETINSGRNFSNTINFLQAGITVGYHFNIKKWQITPGVGYSLMIPFSQKGTVVNDHHEYVELRPKHLNTLVSKIRLNTRISYALSPSVDFFVTGSYNQHLNALYKRYNDTMYSFVGMQAGAFLRL